MPRLTKAELAEKLRKENKRIRDRNYRFRKMTPVQQRITIAKDVLDLLKAEKIRAESGTYLQFDDDVNEKYWGDDWEGTEPEEGAAKVQLHKLIEASETCDVCGIGACFVAAVRRNDACTVGDMDGSDDDMFMREYLGKWFPTSQQQLIETAFECNDTFANGRNAGMAARAVEFGYKYDDDGDRLKAIFENVIANKGEFVPPPIDDDDEDEDDDEDGWL